MVGQWTISPGGLRQAGAGTPRGAHVLASGPLAVDPAAQAFVGVLLENAGKRAVRIGIRLFDLTPCPKRATVDTEVTLDPGCAIGIAFDNPGFFYEVHLVLTCRRDVLATIYGLGPDFSLVAANTRHSGQLVEL